jgi:hypothetical protein
VPDCDADYRATPEQIAADQRRDVAAAVRELGDGADVGAVSERVGLAADVVRRRLTELGPTT